LIPYNKFSEFRLALNLSFIDKSIEKIAGLMKSCLQFDTLSGESIFHRLDARIKLLFMIFFIIIVSLKKDIKTEIIISCIILFLVLISKLSILRFYKRIIFFGFIFGFLAAAPSSLNIITKGEVILSFTNLKCPVNFWIYHIPEEIGITLEGLYIVSLISLRVINSLSISFLVLNTTQFSEIIRALKIFKIPDSFLMILTITYKYIFIFAQTVEDIYLAMKSRIIGPIKNREMRHLVTGRMAFLFRKSRFTCEEVYKAMIARGYTNEIKIYSFNKLKLSDWSAGAVFLILGIVILLM
jgi:cobalt ECF transporter T component CbiQ